MLSKSILCLKYSEFTLAAYENFIDIGFVEEVFDSFDWLSDERFD